MAKNSKKIKAKAAKSAGNPAFVIQKHAARSLHYDFRLEVGGVMKSWAVPKGPSLNPSDKRLAVLTDDHPLSYNYFEGVIPEGEYGGGAVIIWDRRRYKNLKSYTMQTAFRRGVIEVELRGKKVKGGFALVRMQGKSWLLIKMKDAHADSRENLVKSCSESVKSEKTIEQVSAEHKRRDDTI